MRGWSSVQGWLSMRGLPSMQGRSSPLAGPSPAHNQAKRAVGQWFVPRRCADVWPMAAGLSAAGRLVWCTCSCSAWCGEAEGQCCRAAGWGLMVWLSILQLVRLRGPARAIRHQPSVQAPRIRAVFLPVLLFRSWCFHRDFLSPQQASGAWTSLTILCLWGGWPLICGGEQCPARSGPLALLAFKRVSNKASEQWALATALG